MDWRSSSSGVQVQRSFNSSYDQPTWTEPRMLDRKAIVSQLVARYKTKAAMSTSGHENCEAKARLALAETSVLESRETNLEAMLRRNYERQRSRAQSNLMRSKSLGILHNNRGSMESQRARFESEAVEQMKREKSSSRAAAFRSPLQSAEIKLEMNGEVDGMKWHEEKVTTKLPAGEGANEGHVTLKVVNPTRTERRKTIGGIDFEKTAASEAEEKRRSIADFRESSFIQTKEDLSVSVKAISALYLSKVAHQGSTHRLSKPAQDPLSETEKRVRQTKFQPAYQEKCSACSKPVYPMEKITADKYVFHKTCFCCKQCKKKLSMSNYIPLHGEFYCMFHYQQLFRRKGNYDEGFGHAQHKDRWLQDKPARMQLMDTDI